MVAVPRFPVREQDQDQTHTQRGSGRRIDLPWRHAALMRRRLSSPRRPELSDQAGGGGWKPSRPAQVCHDVLVAERVWFASTSGPRLAGLIDHPEGRVRGWGVFAHGFTLGKTRRRPAGSASSWPARASACSASTTSASATPKATGATARSPTRSSDTAQAVRFMEGSGHESGSSSGTPSAGPPSSPPPTWSTPYAPW